MSEEIKCIDEDCNHNIKETKKVGINFIPQMTNDEIKAEINYLIDNRNFENIHSCVCVNCLHEYLNIMKQKIEEEKAKHDNCVISLKDLLMDLSDQNNINQIMSSVLNDIEVNDLNSKYMLSKKERIELEDKMNENKKELINLKKEEENIYLNLNKKEKEKEENREIKDRLKLKLEYLQRVNLNADVPADEFENILKQLNELNARGIIKYES